MEIYYWKFETFTKNAVTQSILSKKNVFVKPQVLGLRLGVDLTFTLDNFDHHNHNNDNNPHLNFFKGTVQYSLGWPARRVSL